MIPGEEKEKGSEKQRGQGHLEVNIMSNLTGTHGFLKKEWNLQGSDLYPLNICHG